MNETSCQPALTNPERRPQAAPRAALGGTPPGGWPLSPRLNRGARQLLRRDVGNLVKHFGRYGLYRDGDRLAGELWEAWLRGLL